MPPGRNIERPERAQFIPLPPNLDVAELIRITPNFDHVMRLDARNVKPETMADAEHYIYNHVIVKGLPLVISNWHLRSDWPSWVFNREWLMENHGKEHIAARDIPNQTDIRMSLQHYLSNLGKLASKFRPNDYSERKQRLYGKDLDCPPVWQNALAELLPKSTFYLNTTADLMSSLPDYARAENMMCYVGHEGTYTPAHKEMCASLGHNIMVAASTLDDNLVARRGMEGTEGSSIWFMMSRDDRDVIAEYWLAQLGHDIEVENHFASVEDLSNAPFKVYIVEQKVGDYILVPPLAPHQVWNRGEFTIKAAWNRTTVDTLELAIKESLPKARLVCRDEQYKNKAIIYETLCKYLRILRNNNDPSSPDHIKDLRSRKTLQSDFVRLFKLFNTILLDHSFGDKEKDLDSDSVKRIDNEYNVMCSFCRCNIWNRFLSCTHCPLTSDDGEEDFFDVCMECYARGRSCGCQSHLSWTEQEDWSELLQKHEEFRSMVVKIEGAVTHDSPKSFYDALKALPRKTVAQVCYEQNGTRPFIDITKDPADESEDDTKTIELKKKTGQLLNCHVCKVRHPRWKSAVCTSAGCTKSYCYGNLWRAFDMDPCDDVLVKTDWKCPVCLGICSCGACQRNPKMNPYKPQGTFLGAVTKDFTDTRSVEVLVDFSKGNLSWIKPGEYDSIARFKRKRNEKDGDDDSMDMDPPRFPRSHWNNSHDDDNGFNQSRIPIDPALAADGNRSEGTDTQSDGNHDQEQRAVDHQHSDGREVPPTTTEKSGGGQYLPSSAHPSSIPPLHTTGDRHKYSSPIPSDKYDPHVSQQHPGIIHHQTTDQGTEMARNRQQRGVVDGHLISSGRGGDLREHRRLTLPSPSAMLTGAPPGHVSSLSPEQNSSHFQSQENTCFNQHYPHPSHHTISSKSSTTNNEYGTNDSHLSELEKNPIAFIAAAGLMQISYGTPHTDDPSQINSSSWTNTTPNPAMTPASCQCNYSQNPSESDIDRGQGNTGSGDSSIGGRGEIAGDISSSSNSCPSMHSTHSSQFVPSDSFTRPSLRYTPTTINPNPAPVPAPLPPELAVLHPHSQKTKLGASADTPSATGAEAQRDIPKPAWVRYQRKLAKDRERWKRARQRSKIVILKVSSGKLWELEQAWKDKAAATVATTGGIPLADGLVTSNATHVVSASPEGDDLVTTDLPPETKFQPRGARKPTITAPIVSEELIFTSTSRKRSHRGWVEISDGEDGDLLDDDTDKEVMPQKRSRRQSAWVARRRQEEWNEDMEYNVALGGAQSVLIKAGTSRSRGVGKKELIGIIKATKEILEKDNTRSRGVAGGKGDNDHEARDGNHGLTLPGSGPPPPPRSESEIRRLAKGEDILQQGEKEREAEEEKRRQEEARRRAEEKAEQTRKFAEEDAKQATKRAEEEALLARIRKEEEARERARQKELKREGMRKERIERAYRESKLFALKVASGELPPDAVWEQEEYSSTFPSSSSEDGENEKNMEKATKTFIPPGKTFVVLLQPPTENWDPKEYEEIPVDSNSLCSTAYSTFKDITIPAFDTLLISRHPPPTASVTTPPAPSTSKYPRRGRPSKTPRLNTRDKQSTSTTSAAPDVTAQFPIKPTNPPSTSTSKPKRKPTTGSNDDTPFRGRIWKPRNRKITDAFSGHDVEGVEYISPAKTDPRKRTKASTISDKGSVPKSRRRASAAAKLQSTASTTTSHSRSKGKSITSSPPSLEATHMRHSTRQRKPRYSNLNLHSEDDIDREIEELIAAAAADEDDLVRGDLDVEVEIDPDIGVLEREKERLVRIREKRRYCAKTKRALSESISPEREEEEQEDDGAGMGKQKEVEKGRSVSMEWEAERELFGGLEVEEEYNSRWRRKTAKW